MAEQIDEKLDAEVASILRRPADDPERRYLESEIEASEAMFLYARHFVSEDGMESGPRNCEECGEPFTPPRNDRHWLYCSMACLRKCISRTALRSIRSERQSDAAERESQPT